MMKKSIGILCLISILVISGASAAYLNGNFTDLTVSKDILNNSVDKVSGNHDGVNSVELAKHMSDYVTNSMYAGDAEMEDTSTIYSSPSSAYLENALDKHSIVGIDDNGQVYSEPLYNTKVDYFNAHQDNSFPDTSDDNQLSNVDLNSGSDDSQIPQYKNEYCIEFGDNNIR